MKTTVPITIKSVPTSGQLLRHEFSVEGHKYSFSVMDSGVVLFDEKTGYPKWTIKA